VTDSLEEKIMKSLITVVAALAISSGSLCFAADRGANVYNLQMLHSSGGEFSWQEMGSGVNQFSFSSYDYSNTFEMAFVIEGSVDINLAALMGWRCTRLVGDQPLRLQLVM
jgi:hypothetical protein